MTWYRSNLVWALVPKHPTERRPVARRSFSALTICEIRQGPCRKGEGTADRFRRLCGMYGLEPVELRLLMQVDDEHIDAIGRIRD